MGPLRVAMVLLLPSTGIGADSPSAPPRPEPYRVAVAHILVRHRGSFEPAGVTRSRGEALELAAAARKQALAPGVDFRELSRRLSEDRTRRASGGYLGVFRRGMLAEDFAAVEDAVFRLGVGEVSPPVESPLGIHVFVRVPIEEWAGSHVLVQYRGCRKAPADLRRDRAAAKALAEKLLARARRPGTDFAELARRYSEAPDRAVGGSLGVFTPHTIVPEVEKAIAALTPGEVGGLVASPLGFHIVRRERLVRRRLALIRVAPEEASLAAFEAARERAVGIGARARRGDVSFAALAKAHSRHARAKYGGELGEIPVGILPARLAAAARRLEEGEVSPVVECDGAFFLLRRIPARR